MPDPETLHPGKPTPSLRLSQWHRRLARYLYLDAFITGRRVLEIGCGDGRAAVFLAQRGASHVVGIDFDEEAIGSGQQRNRHANLTLRLIDRADLTRPGGLGEPGYDLILLADNVDLLHSDSFLEEIRRVRTPGGYLLVAIRSREADPGAPDAMSYFDLVDRLDQAGGLGPVTMLGQSPFLATTLAPFGVEEPPLVMDDSLTVQEPPEEYVALCGPRPEWPLPYQVIQLPQAALDMPPAPSVQAAPLHEELERLRLEGRALQQEIQALREKGAALAAERTQLHEALERASNERKELEQRIAEAEGRLREQTAELAELRERLAQRDQAGQEQAAAAVLFEQKLRELRSALEERDAFIAELEAQALAGEELRARANAAERRAEQAEQAERAARQKLAELEGALLRAQAELKALREGQPLPGSAPSMEAALLEQRRHEAEQAMRILQQERQALEEAQRALAEDRQALARGAEEIAQLREAIEEERRQLAQEREELQRLRAQLERERQAMIEAQSTDVPIPVGDLPTAPHVSFSPTTPVSPQEEVQRLQARLLELELESARLKEKASEAERESWKYMKARSDAEAAAEAARDEAARKLRDARKLASIELTRAMEEATKKAVQLREELTRTERERKDALAQVQELRAARDAALRQVEALRQELEALRWSSALPMPSLETAGEDVHKEVARAREEGAAAVLAVRAEAERAIADERAARQSAEEAERRANMRAEELSASLLQLELQLGEARDAVEAERRRVEMLQDEVRRLTDEGAARQREAEAELLRIQQDLQARERTIADLRTEREALGRLLQEVEREAYSRAERARELRARMLERDREIEALRVELLDRDRKIMALEKQLPPHEEVARLEADLQVARARIQELEAERGRQDAASDEAVATALRERARAARLTESLQQAARERDEAQNRCAELEQRMQTLLEERNRLRAETSRLEELVRIGQAEALQAEERLKQMRRELEAEQKRAAREAESARAAAELGQRLDEARGELATLRVRSLELQAELARCRAELARAGGASAAPAAPAAVSSTSSAQQTSAQQTSAPEQSQPPVATPTPQTPSPEGALQPPVLHEQTVRRVIALGQALGLEPLQVPIHAEPGQEKASIGREEDPEGKPSP
ncbi:MAG: methyltransferase domain-containing protein [Myxococcales bacterium]|nr:methyltransferase domain-containing protein [Myxococcota bacterium]MDW8280831.1 methyltransferase domain-containing protein [Myxococcales bacterium]